MAYTAIDNSQSVIQHYGKKGMKWRKNRNKARKVNKQSTLNIGNGSPRI